MQNILEEFYLGNISPNQQLKPQDPEYKECFQYSLRNEAELMETLNENEKAVYEKFIDNLDTVHQAEVIQSFINGYKLGSLIMMEVLVDKESLYDWDKI